MPTIGTGEDKAYWSENQFYHLSVIKQSVEYVRSHWDAVPPILQNIKDDLPPPPKPFTVTTTSLLG